MVLVACRRSTFPFTTISTSMRTHVTEPLDPGKGRIEFVAPLPGQRSGHRQLHSDEQRIPADYPYSLHRHVRCGLQRLDAAAPL